jgi:hypothetical protein
MEPETPLKGRGGSLEAGWEAWRADAAQLNANVRRRVPQRAAGAASHSSPPLGAQGSASSAATPRPAAALPATTSRGGPFSFASFLSRELSWGQGLSWRARGAPTEHVMNFLRVNLALEGAAKH